MNRHVVLVNTVEKKDAEIYMPLKTPKKYATHEDSCLCVIKQAPSKISPARTERSIKSTNPIHILTVFSLLLLPNTINIIARHFGVFRASKFRETHCFSH